MPRCLLHEDIFIPPREMKYKSKGYQFHFPRHPPTTLWHFNLIFTSKDIFDRCYNIRSIQNWFLDTLCGIVYMHTILHNTIQTLNMYMHIIYRYTFVLRILKIWLRRDYHNRLVYITNCNLNPFDNRIHFQRKMINAAAK